MDYTWVGIFTQFSLALKFALLNADKCGIHSYLMFLRLLLICSPADSLLMRRSRPSTEVLRSGVLSTCHLGTRNQLPWLQGTANCGVRDTATQAHLL
jgi:hypothetical protein